MGKATVAVATCFIVFSVLLFTLNATPLCAAYEKPTIYVQPAKIVDTTLTPGQNFTVEIKLREGVNLYAVELKLTWSNTLLEYASHMLLLGQPGGVLNAPVNPVKNGVFTDAGGNSYYWLVATSMPPASGWSGNGTIVRFTFRVKSIGWCMLDIYGTDIANYNAQRLSHNVEDGYFCNAEFQGDIDGDGLVALSDLVLLARAYGAEPDDPAWDWRCDLDGDLKIGLSDLVLLARNYGRTRE